MATNLARIQRQIERLQKEAAALKRKEVGGVIARIKAAIEQYGITVTELFGGGAKPTGKRRGRPAGKAATKSTRTAKRSAKAHESRPSTATSTATRGPVAATSPAGWWQP